MNQNVQAIYSNGMLKPLGPLALREDELVELTVSPVVDDSNGAHMTEDEFEKLLFATGRLCDVPSPITDFTVFQNREPVRIDGCPLSETVIADRR